MADLGMDGGGARVRGFDELARLLDGLPDKLERNVVRGALRAGLSEFRDEAQRHVPVASGALRDSIRVSVRLRRGVPTGTLRAGGRGKGKTSVWYAHLVEFGTRAHEIKPKARKSLFVAGLMREVVQHPGAQARPFMRPAWDAAHVRAVQAYAAYIRRRLTKQGLDVPDMAGAVMDSEA